MLIQITRARFGEFELSKRIWFFHSTVFHRPNPGEFDARRSQHSFPHPGKRQSSREEIRAPCLIFFIGYCILRATFICNSSLLQLMRDTDLFACPRPSSPPLFHARENSPHGKVSAFLQIDLTPRRSGTHTRARRRKMFIKWGDSKSVKIFLATPQPPTLSL